MYIEYIHVYLVALSLYIEFHSQYSKLSEVKFCIIKQFHKSKTVYFLVFFLHWILRGFYNWKILEPPPNKN